MPLIKIKLKGGDDAWVNTQHVVSLAIGRSSDTLELVTTEILHIDSAYDVAKAMQEAEQPVPLKVQVLGDVRTVDNAIQ